MEYAIASNWLLRIGILIVVMGIGFFLKYSFENDLIDPIGRVLIGAAVGLSMTAAGTQMLGRKYHLFGQGIIGGGIAILYLQRLCRAAFTISVDRRHGRLRADDRHHVPRRLDRRPLPFDARGRAGHPRRIRHARHAPDGHGEFRRTLLVFADPGRGRVRRQL